MDDFDNEEDGYKEGIDLLEAPYQLGKGCLCFLVLFVVGSAFAYLGVRLAMWIELFFRF